MALPSRLLCTVHVEPSPVIARSRFQSSVPDSASPYGGSNSRRSAAAVAAPLPVTRVPPASAAIANCAGPPTTLTASAGARTPDSVNVSVPLTCDSRGRPAKRSSLSMNWNSPATVLPPGVPSGMLIFRSSRPSPLTCAFSVACPIQPATGLASMKRWKSTDGPAALPAITSNGNSARRSPISAWIAPKGASATRPRAASIASRVPARSTSPSSSDKGGQPGA